MDALLLRFAEVVRRTEQELVRVRGRLRNLKKSRRGWRKRDRLDWFTREEARLTKAVAVYDEVLQREVLRCCLARFAINPEIHVDHKYAHVVLDGVVGDAPALYSSGRR